MNTKTESVSTRVVLHKDGRLLIPKSMRVGINLPNGGDVLLTPTSSGIMLQPVTQRCCICNSQALPAASLYALPRPENKFICPACRAMILALV